MRLWPGARPAQLLLARARCSGRARTAAQLGVPHHVLDREAEFEARGRRPVPAGYLGGETPNPCVDCNPMRLAALVGLADELGLARVATGHYARLVWRDGEPFVARAADRAKDQSYMLWAVPPEVLARLEFPLGELDQGRRAGTSRRTAASRSRTSPRARRCASPSTGTSGSSRSAASSPPAGDIVDAAGAVLGRHQGHWRYTVGQRRGLGVSAPASRCTCSSGGPPRTKSSSAAGRDLATRSVRVRDVVDRGLGDGARAARAAALPLAGGQRRRARAATPGGASSAPRGAASPASLRGSRRCSTATTSWSAAASSPAPSPQRGEYDTLRPSARRH